MLVLEILKNCEVVGLHTYVFPKKYHFVHPSNCSNFHSLRTAQVDNSHFEVVLETICFLIFYDFLQFLEERLVSAQLKHCSKYLVAV